MKKVLIAIMLLLSTATMAQRLSVLGIEMGSSYENAEKILDIRFGKKNVVRYPYKELGLIKPRIGGYEWDMAQFLFQSEVVKSTRHTCLSRFHASKSFEDDRDEAESFYLRWNENLYAKYVCRRMLKSKDGETLIVWYTENEDIALTFTLHNGKYFVQLDYFDNTIDESNDF
jgi:hypothetical protein